MDDPGAKQLLKDALTEIGAQADPQRMEDLLPALRQFLDAFAAWDFECVMRGLPPTPPVSEPGIEGLDKAWRDYAEAFEDVRIEFEDLLESDGYVVSLGNQVARTRHGGVELAQPSALVFAFEGGLVKRIEFHLDRPEALRTAGLADG